ncbi:hypothetical protein AGLY_009635 [Aphis glycines]|uniref:ClpX-type ZB domain-containing protein n=1 Tax=Aphis glycines TaxID=307491 RepID=A0A6G0TGE6_APHGL|nr:hypothetical protein AGLY_009635 [Aphis glycines]
MTIRLKYLCLKICTRSKLDTNYLNLSRNLDILFHGHNIKDTVHRRNFQTSPSHWKAEQFWTGQKGNNTGQTRILCSKCQNVNLVFFLFSNRFLVCQRCGYIFKVISAEKNNFKPPPPFPKEIVMNLNKYIIGQDLAKKVLAVAIYNHCKRIIHITAPQKNDLIEHLLDNSHSQHSKSRFSKKHNILSRILQMRNKKKNQEEIKIASTFENTRIEKSNIILLGPTGCGKTLLAQTVAKQLEVPFAICDCSHLTQSGYTGENIESIVIKLLQAANYDVKKAQTGIVFLDEIDKISAVPDMHQLRDVGGTGVQQGMLKMLEGTVINVPGKNRNKTVQVDTTNILFVASGAFIGLNRLISQRTNQITLGFGAEIDRTMVSKKDAAKSNFVDSKASYTADIEKENVERDKLLKKVEPRDLIKFGMIPEFVGRFPILVPFHSLNISLLVRILTEPKNSSVNQFKLLFSLEKVELTFTDEALRVIASQALEKKTGARGLRAILECILLDSMFEIPRSNIVGVHVNEDTVVKKNKPYYIRDHPINKGNQNGSKS